MKTILYTLMITFLFGCFGATPKQTGLEGQLLPNFSFRLIDSITYYAMNNIPKEKAFALIYFTPTCPYCRAQTQEIVDDFEKLKDMQFYLISSYPISSIRQFSEEYSLAKYPNIVIGGDTGNIISDYFEIPGVPYIAIYGKDKRLNHAFLGKLYSSQIKEIADQ